MNTSPDCASLAKSSQSDGAHGKLEKALRVFSLLTMAMTVPQVLAVWHGRVQGVSAISWSAYLISSCLWMLHGLRTHDRSIYLPCVGWIALDASIVAGVLAHG
jgi:uncharacterized protein with PQ loop repeat